MFTLREIKEFNTIELIDGDQDLIFDFYNSLPCKFNFNFVLYEGVIKTKSSIFNIETIEYIYFHYNEKNKLIHIEDYGYYNYNFANLFIIDLDLEKSLKENQIIYQYMVPVKISDVFKMYDNLSFGYVANYVNATLLYLENLISNRETKIKHIERKNKSDSRTSKTSQSKKLKKRIIYLHSDKIKYELNLDNAAHDLFKRHYNRYAESWTVRGHYRQLKDGRKIYIKPYNKGKGKIEKKIYKP